MSPAARDLARRNGLRAAAALVAAAALGGALYRVPTLLGAAHRYLHAPGMSLDNADLDPARYFVSIGALVAARNTIPPGVTYTIVVGHDPPLDTDPVRAAKDALEIPIIFQTWLLPLRYTPKLHDAQWVIAYHRASGTVGVKYSKVTYLSWEANLLEVVH